MEDVLEMLFQRAYKTLREYHHNSKIYGKDYFLTDNKLLEYTILLSFIREVGLIEEYKAWLKQQPKIK